MAAALETEVPISVNVVGIDLGTTFSSVAVFKNGKPEVIPDKLFGERLVPSVVFFDPNNTDLSVGKFAEEWGMKERSNVIYDTKRLMGRKYDDIYVQDLIESGEYTYKIVRSQEDDAAIQIKQNKETVEKLPEEIGAEILKYLKDSASKYLGKIVTEAVISVPAHFCNAQRQATVAAATLSGLKVVKLISEPVAAAIYYSMEKIGEKSTLMVIDIGGGTLDVSIVMADEKKFQVRGLEGDSFLGGRDFDRNLANHCFSKFLDNAENKDTIKERHLLRVKKKCTDIKKMLSASEQAAFTLPHFGDNENSTLSVIITRQTFESLNEVLFNRIMDLVKQCLADTGLLKEDIDQVILVGGSSRIPKIQNIIGSYFGTNKIKTDINPDEAVALGAAITAAVYSANNNKSLEKYKITEIAPLSIGIDICGKVMKVGISKNTPLPAISKIAIITSINDQTSLRQNIYEGERKNCGFNTLLGSLTLDNLPPGKAGSVKLHTTFELNANGLLTVKTANKRNQNKVVLTLKEHRLSQNKIKSSFEEAIRFKKEDELFENFMRYIYNSRGVSQHIIYDLSKIGDFENRNIVEELCDDYEYYLDGALKSEVTEKKFSDLKATYQTFKNNVQPLIRGSIEVEWKV